MPENPCAFTLVSQRPADTLRRMIAQRTIGEMCAWWPDLEQLALTISRRVEIEQQSLRILAPPLEYRIVQDPRDGYFSVGVIRSAAGDFGEFSLPLSRVFDFLGLEPVDPGAESAPELRLRTMLINAAQVHRLFNDFDDRRWRDLYWFNRGCSVQYTAQFTEQYYGC
jgi:hypothetical protein